MKIFAITGNSSRTTAAVRPKPENAESQSLTDATFGWRFLPDSAIFRSPNPFYFDNEEDVYEAFPSLAVRIDRLGKSVAPRFAHRYTGHVALAVNFRAISLERMLAASGQPVDPAWGYDRSLLLSDWVEMPLEAMRHLFINLSLSHEDTVSSQQLHTASLTFSIEEVIAKVSICNTLKMGDVVCVGFPDNGLVLTPDSTLTSTIFKTTDPIIPIIPALTTDIR